MADRYEPAESMDAFQAVRRSLTNTLDRLEQQLADAARRAAEARASHHVADAASLSGQVSHPVMSDVLNLLREAQAQAITKAEAAAMWQARAEMLAGQLTQARSGLATSEALASSTLEPGDQEEADVSGESDAEALHAKDAHIASLQQLLQLQQEQLVQARSAAQAAEQAREQAEAEIKRRASKSPAESAPPRTTTAARAPARRRTAILRWVLVVALMALLALLAIVALPLLSTRGLAVWAGTA